MFYSHPERLPCLNNNEANKEKYILVWPSLLFPFLPSSSPVRNSISSLITNSSTFSPFSSLEKSLQTQLPFIALRALCQVGPKTFSFSLPSRATPRASHHLWLPANYRREAKGCALHSPDTGNPLGYTGETIQIKAFLMGEKKIKERKKKVGG